MFVAWVTILVLTLVITVAKEFIDKSKWSHTTKTIWTALVALVAASGAIFTISRAISAETRQAATTSQINRLAEETRYRHIDHDQRLALTEVLSTTSYNGSPIQVHSVSGDSESAAFGIRLANAIRAAGWPAEHENMAFFGAPHGLEIRFPGNVQDPMDVPDTDKVSCPACMVLARGLERTGHKCKVVMWPTTSLAEHTIELVVGYKPLTQE